jgi:prophage maintenance system killer protein
VPGRISYVPNVIGHLHRRMADIVGHVVERRPVLVKPVALVLIASRTLGLDTGQVLDLVDVAAAENALAEAQPGSGSADPALRAAALLHALARQRPLRRGNQQVALAAMLQFLAINGWDMDPNPPGPVAAMVAGLTAGTAGTRDAAALLASRLRPSDQHNRPGHDDQTKEAPMRPRPALPLAERIKSALRDPRRTRVYPRGFTDRHKQAVDLSLEEARRLGHDYLGTEHLLLGLLGAGDGVAIQVLASMGIPLDEVRSRVEGIITHGPGTRAGPILTLRDREDQLRADKLRLEQQWAAGVDVQAVVAENQRVHRELDRMRGLLREHGIEPEDGTAQTA